MDAEKFIGTLLAVLMVAGIIAASIWYPPSPDQTDLQPCYATSPVC